MNQPVKHVRTLLLVGLVSVGFVIAGAGLAGITSGATGPEDAAESLGQGSGSATALSTEDVPTFPVSEEPVAQTGEPGPNGTAANNSAGQGSNQTTDSNDDASTSSPPGQSNSSDEQTAGKNQPDQASDSAKDNESTQGNSDTGSSSATDGTATNSNNNSNSAANDSSPSDNSGNEGAASNSNNNSNPPANDASNGGNADNAGTPANGESSSAGNGTGESPGNSGSTPAEQGSGGPSTGESPGAAPNDSGAEGPGAPEWVDSGGPSNESPQGPPWGPGGPSNGTTHTVPVGGENVTITVSQGPPETTPGSRVAAHVANATPNGSIPVELPQQAVNASVRTEQLSVNVSERQNFSLGVTTRSDRDPNRTPEFTPPEAAEDVGYISVDHTVPDSEIENVTFRFAVDSEKVNPGEREDITLYRYHNESWNEVPTDYVDRNGTAYVFEAQAPGLSEFTVGKKVPAFEIKDAELQASVQTTADPVDVRVRITNEGGADGVYTARLLLDQEERAEDQLSIAAGGTRQTSFEESITEAGEYRVVVNNFTVGTIDVDPALPESTTAEADPMSAETIETLSAQNASDVKTKDTNQDSVTSTEMPGFGLLAGVIGLLVAVLRIRRGTD